MRAALIAVWPMLMTVCLMAAGLNAFMTHSILSVTGFGYTNVVIGLVSTAFYAGLLVGSVGAFRLIGQVGHVRVFAAAAGLTSVSALVGPFLLEPYLWALIRFAIGASMAAAMICIESWLNERADNTNRGQVMGLYQSVFYGFGIAGNLLVGIDDDTQQVLMMIVAMLFSVALIPVALLRVPAPALPDSGGGLSLARLYRVSPLGFIGVFVSGLTLGMMFGAGPLYATMNGLTVEETTYFMSALIAGALIFIGPIGKISDVLDRRRVMLGVATGVILAGIALVIFPAFMWVKFLAASVVFGGLLTSLYPLSLSLVNDRMESSELSAAATAIMIIYGVGAIFGPVTASGAIEIFGEDGFVFSICAVMAGLAVFALWRMTRREAPSAEDSGDYYVVPTASAVAFDGAEYDGTDEDSDSVLTWAEEVAEQQALWRDEAEAEDAQAQR